jgi:hypothetical protein
MYTIRFQDSNVYFQRLQLYIFTFKRTFPSNPSVFGHSIFTCKCFSSFLPHWYWTSVMFYIYQSRCLTAGHQFYSINHYSLLVLYYCLDALSIFALHIIGPNPSTRHDTPSTQLPTQFTRLFFNTRIEDLGTMK